MHSLSAIPTSRPVPAPGRRWLPRRASLDVISIFSGGIKRLRPRIDHAMLAFEDRRQFHHLGLERLAGQHVGARAHRFHAGRDRAPTRGCATGRPATRRRACSGPPRAACAPPFFSSSSTSCNARVLNSRILRGQHDDRDAIFFALAQALAGFDDRVEQRGAGPGHREDLADAVVELLLAGGVVAQDRRTIGDADDRDRADAVELP